MSGGPAAESGARVTALILAGERGGANPVAEAAGVAQKCWAPVAGVPMLLRVVETLAGRPYVARIAVALQDGGSDQEAAALAAPIGAKPVIPLASGQTPSTSILEAVRALSEPFPLLVTTADHPLLSAAMVDHFWTAFEASGAEVAAAVTPAQVIEQAYPETRRTYLGFGDGRRSGANLFAIANQRGLRAVEFWKRIEEDRKKPWRIMGAFGLRPLLAYLFGRLTVEGAARQASRIFSAEAAILDLPFAEAAIDVDRPADLALAERILRQREQERVQARASL